MKTEILLDVAVAILYVAFVMMGAYLSNPI